MDEVGRHREILGQLRPLSSPENIEPLLVAKGPDQPVNPRIFAKGLHSRGQNDQLPAIGDGHAGAVNGLVTHPGAAKLLRIRINQNLLQGPRKQVQIVLLTEGHCRLEHLPLPTHEEAHKRYILTLGLSHRKDVGQGEAVQEVLFRVVKDLAHRGVVTAHQLLHAVNRPQEMRFVDDLLPAAAHYDVLGVVGHAHNFMGNHLADGDNQIIGAFQDLSVDLHGDGKIQQSLGNLLHKGSRYHPDFGHIAPPSVVDVGVQGNLRPEDTPFLTMVHGRMGSQGRQDLHYRWPQQAVKNGGYGPAHAVSPGTIWRNEQNLAQRPIQAIQPGPERLLHCG